MRNVTVGAKNRLHRVQFLFSNFLLVFCPSPAKHRCDQIWIGSIAVPVIVRNTCLIMGCMLAKSIHGAIKAVNVPMVTVNIFLLSNRDDNF